ncbi:MAG TPA: hypothetical protein VFX49_14490 [Chloroflexota bacterium]|nr:hypothetical protein [Chloroflexota bacterium]
MAQRYTLAPPYAPPLTRPFPTLIPWAIARAEPLTLAAVISLSFLHFLRIYDRGFNLLDEGFVLHVAERVLQGQVPYRDFFTQLTPGAFLALAAVFKLTGPSVLVGRWVTLLLGLAITAMLYWGGRQLVARPTAALAALAFPVWGIGQGWFYPNYSWFALCCAVAALCCALRAIRLTAAPDVSHRLGANPLAWHAAAGLLCGAAAFCKQNIGLYAAVGLCAATLIALPTPTPRRVLSTAVLAAASLPIPLALLLWLAANGALDGFVRDAVWIPLRVFPLDMAAPYPPSWPPWPVPTDRPGYGEWAFRLVCLLPPLPYALAIVSLAVSTLLHRGAPTASHRASLAAWLAFGLAIWATAFPRADFDHVQVALGPAFVLGASGFESIGGMLWRRRGPFIASALLGGFLLAGVGNARLLHMGPDWTLRGIAGSAPRAAGLKLDHDEAMELRHLIGEVRRLTEPGDRIAALPWNAGLYFLAERRNATRFDLFIPASVLDDDMPEIERSLATAGLIVLWTPRDPFVNNTSFDDRYPGLDRFIHTHFTATAAVNAYRLLLPASG